MRLQRKNALIIMTVSVVAVIISVVGYNLVTSRSSKQTSISETSIAETTIPESTYSDKIDDGPVKVGEEVSIEVQETKNDSINMEVNSEMSGFKSNAGKTEANGLVIEQDVAIHSKKELTANVDWSDYELNDSELREMLSIGARLVEIEMNESGKYGSVEITPVLPNVEELNEFTAPIMYSVSEDGVLTMNAKLQITNKSESTYKEVLTPISVYYEGNVVKLKVE